MKIIRIPYGSLFFYFVQVFCKLLSSFRAQTVSLGKLRNTWTVPSKLPFIFSDILLALGSHGHRCQKPLNLTSFHTYSGQCGASEHQQVKFIRPYLDLGIVPIKQNRVVEQESNGPLGIRPNALWLKFMLL